VCDFSFLLHGSCYILATRIRIPIYTQLSPISGRQLVDEERIQKVIVILWYWSLVPVAVCDQVGCRFA